MSQYARVDQLDPAPWSEDFDHPEDYIAQLAEDIAERGVQRPVHVFPRGDRYEVLGGHDRLEASKRAGKAEVPIVVRSMLSTEDERFEYFCKDNMHKPRDARAYARAGLNRWPEMSNREIARRVGVHHVTVGSVRDEMEQAGELVTVTSSTGADGKRRPARKPKASGKQKDSTTGVAPGGRTKADRAKRDAQYADYDASFPDPKPGQAPKDGNSDAVASSDEDDGDGELTGHPEPAIHSDPPAAPSSRTVTLPRRPYTRKAQAFIDAAVDFADAEDDEIRNIPVNSEMLDELRKARDLIDRIFSIHNTEADNAAA